uniref:Uncharacterized protein n=1 Tax=Arundo donax TaxID=35708 RepID=A0A0A9CQF4_ARUDO
MFEINNLQPICIYDISSASVLIITSMNLLLKLSFCALLKGTF